MGKQTYTNINGTWKKNNKIHTKVVETWKEIKKGYVNISGIWKQIHATGGLPAGAIIPYNSSASVPSGTTEFTAANNRYIVGAGSSYSATSTGGSTSVSVATTSSTNGSHTGATFSVMGSTSSSSTEYGAKHTSSSFASGNHSHSISGTASGEPSFRAFRLIKLNQDLSSFPINSVALSFTSLTNGMSVLDISNTYMKASTTNGTTGGGSISLVTTTSSSGAHNHVIRTTTPAFESGGYKYVFNVGSHSHSTTLTGSVEPTYRYLSAWYSSTTEVEVSPNVIVMYEGTTAPEGWQICDGSNGSPDMRDYFLRIGTEANHNTSGGSFSLSLSGSTSSGGSHHHRGSVDAADLTRNHYHSNTVAMAGHTFSWNGTYIPPYYALTFIMKLS